MQAYLEYWIRARELLGYCAARQSLASYSDVNMTRAREGVCMTTIELYKVKFGCQVLNAAFRDAVELQRTGPRATNRKCQMTSCRIGEIQRQWRDPKRGSQYPFSA